MMSHTCRDDSHLTQDASPTLNPPSFFCQIIVIFVQMHFKTNNF